MQQGSTIFGGSRSNTGEQKELTEIQRNIQNDIQKILPSVKIPIEQICPQSRIDRPEAITEFLIKNGKTQTEAKEITALIIEVQKERAKNLTNGPAQQELTSYANAGQNTVKDKLGEAREDAKSPQTLKWLEGELNGLERQEDAARKRGNFEQAAVLESTQNYLVQNVAFIEGVRAKYGDVAAQDAERALHQVAEECAASGVSPFEYAEKDASESKNPLNHITELQAKLAETAGLRIGNFFVMLKAKFNAKETEMVGLARIARDATVDALKDDASLRGSRPEDYQAFLAEDDAKRKQQILEKTGFTENTARYLEGYTAAEMGSAFAAVGLAILAGAVTGGEVQQAPGAEVAAAAQFQMDAILKRKEAQQQLDEMNDALKELEEQDEKDTVEEAELSPETLQLLEKAGIEKEDTIKEAIEAVETIIANIEMQGEKIEGLRKGFNEEEWEGGLMPPLHSDPMEVLEANGLMEDGKLTELGKEMMPGLLQESAADFMQACDTILFRIEIVGNEELMDKLNDAKRAVEDYMVNPESVEKLQRFNEVMADPEIVAVQAAFFEAIAENAGEVVSSRAREEE